MQCIKIVVTAAGNMKLLAIATHTAKTEVRFSYLKV